jgi:hypothetical protein
MLIALGASLASAATVTSSFDSWLYAYTITPETGETLRSFHIYTGVSECDASHYYDLVMPAGWMFDVIPVDETKCVITFWTEGEPLPVGVATDFGFVHYCAPCCHSWYVAEPGTSDPNVPPVDDDEQHTEPCNIPSEFADQCGGPGLILAPIYPQGVPNELQTWGTVKSIYR